MIKELEKGQLFRLYSIFVIAPLLIIIAFRGRIGNTERIILYTIAAGTFLTATVAYLYTEKSKNELS